MKVLPAILLLLLPAACSTGRKPPSPGEPGLLLPDSPERPAPCECPPKALQGLTLCLDPLPGAKERTVQAMALYLGRLARKSGARTALTRFARPGLPGFSGEDLDRTLATARKARARLLLRISGSPPPVLPTRPLTREERLLARLLVEQRALSGGKALVLPVPGPGPLPPAALRIVLAGTSPPDFRPHRAPAKAAFRALLAWWKALGSPGPEGKKTSRSRTPWGRPPATVEEARFLLRCWRRGEALDPTQGWLQVDVGKRGEEWILSGSTEFPGLARAAERVLRDAGLRRLVNRIRLLPSREAGNPPYGILRASRALTWAKPRPAHGLPETDGPGQVEETELLYGDPLRILDAEGGFLLVHSAGGYLGWVKKEFLLRCTKARFLSLLSAGRVLFLGPFRAGGLEIPAGAALPFRGRKKGEVLVESAEGKLLEVPSRLVRLPRPGSGRGAAALALTALGTPYVFGGRDRREGIDCSGLVQAAWASQGVELPRDARMQVLCGRLVGWAGRWEALRPGDLLFFLNRRGRVSHVALSLGGSRFVHASPPEVTLGSLDPADPWYTPTAKAFVLAKRIQL